MPIDESLIPRLPSSSDRIESDTIRATKYSKVHSAM